MKTKVKEEPLCYQVLFNKPLFMKPENKNIYGFRVLVDEENKDHFTDKELMEYTVEQVIGKCLFQAIHDGSFEGHKGDIWIDRDGNDYLGGGYQTRLYCYDAAIENGMNYRYDLVYAPCESEEGDNYWITDPTDYFECRAMMDEDDYKFGKNQWLENYNRLQRRRSLLTGITISRTNILDYDLQEVMKEEWLGIYG